MFVLSGVWSCMNLRTNTKKTCISSKHKTPQSGLHVEKLVHSSKFNSLQQGIGETYMKIQEGRDSRL